MGYHCTLNIVFVKMKDQAYFERHISHQRIDTFIIIELRATNIRAISWA